MENHLVFGMKRGRLGGPDLWGNKGGEIGAVLSGGEQCYSTRVSERRTPKLR